MGPYLISFEHLQRLLTDRRREVDQIVRDTPCQSKAGGFVGKGCVAAVHSPFTSVCGTGRSSIGQIGLSGHAIEYVCECLLRQLERPPLPAGHPP